MKLTIHRGTHEIGGSCIELATGTTRIVLDAGLPLVDANREPFDASTIQGKSVAELVVTGTVPRVVGLFTEGDPPQAIFLSHSHLDHSGLLHLSNPQVPIYASKGTSKVMLAGAVFSRQQQLDRDRHREMNPGEPVQVGDIQVTAHAVDHSAFGSLAFLIEAEGKRILYSGDIRRHGRKPGMINSLVAVAQATGIDVLLMEGTHVGSGRETGPTEHELEEQVVELVTTTPGLVLAAFSPVDVDRLVTFYRSSQRTGRVFVADAYAAIVLHLVASDAQIPRPTREAGIRVFYNRAFEQRYIDRLSQLFAQDRIDLEEILSQPGRHLMVFRPSMTKLDFGGQLPTRSRCIYSYWAGYLKNPDWVNLQRTLQEAGGDFHPAHASGHIYVRDLIEFVQAVNAKTVIP